MGPSPIVLRIAAFLAGIVFAATPAPAQPSEQAVKAAFLPKFARYVTWPPHARPGPGRPLNLCIIGSDRFGPLLTRAAQGQSAGQSPITVHRLESAERAAFCHIAFINGVSPARTAATVKALQKWPILTVTDDRDGATRGMVHFILHQGRVRFHIDDQAAESSNLQLDSRLLAIALDVKPRRR